MKRVSLAVMLRQQPAFAVRKLKLKHRDTFELIAVAGAVTGPLDQPGEVILGVYVDGELRIVGRTTAIQPGPLCA
jgi:hypothetical protein